jgi:hypothetical protein
VNVMVDEIDGVDAVEIAAARTEEASDA